LDESKRQEYLAFVSARLGKKRLTHTLGVEKMAIELAGRFGADVAAAQTAALLHDAAKNGKKQEKRDLAQIYNIEPDPIEERQIDLLHGALAAQMARRELGVEDEDVLNAIRYHTTGRAGMSRLEKIIYLADLIEENRDFRGVKALRRLARTAGLDEALLAGMRHVLLYVIREGGAVHPDSIDAYNALLMEKGDKE